MSLFIPYYISKKDRINKLVLSSGSTKGIAYFGVIKGLEENNLIDNFKTFAGSSIGSLVSFLLVIGYRYDDFYKLITSINLESLCKMGSLNNYGFDSGNNIVNEIKKIMDEKNIKHNITFKELFEKTNKRLIVCATNLTQKKAEYFDYKRSPNMSVLISIRMSISVPIIYSPIIYKDNFYVDGGLVDCLPYSIFKNKDKCLNIYIESGNEIKDMTSYLLSLFDFAGSTKNIDNLGIKNLVKLNIQMIFTNFKLNLEDIQKIIDCGYKEIICWIKNK